VKSAIVLRLKSKRPGAPVGARALVLD